MKILQNAPTCGWGDLITIDLVYYCNIREIPVLLITIETVADYKIVNYFKSNIIWLNVDNSFRLLVKKANSFQGFGLHFHQLVFEPF